MKSLKTLSISTLFAACTLITSQVQAAKYTIDTEGAHAFVQFRIKHLGYSWLYGRFNEFKGSFGWDASKPEASTIEVTVNTNSLDSNHAERDKHIRSDDFLNTSKFSEATFVSKKVVKTGDKTAQMTGDLTIHGVTKSISLEATFIGEGKDPWGGYRAGFQAQATIKPGDFGVDTEKQLGQTEVELIISVEGIRQ
jgi:polyisoprenoid-binding protein YceI